MNLNETESLAAIEYLMEEFFNPMTCNSRKHEIEQQLNSFKNAPELWNLCLYFITNTSSQYVTMFALSTLETVINQHWSSTYWPNKDSLKNILTNYLIEKGNSAPHFIRNKYAKLLVEIAKQDWPGKYPNYLINILELLKSEHNQLIGLILLKTTSDEFMGLQASFEHARKLEIRRLMNEYIPAIFELLNNILENLANKSRHHATATPPPSPTHPTPLPNFSQQLASAAFRPDFKLIKKEVLNTIQSLFSWVELGQIPSQLIKSIFNFTNISSYAQDDDDMSVLALSAINELLYKKYAPPGTQDSFLQIYYNVIQLLRDIVCSSTYRIDTLDLVFVEKLTEMLILLMQHHCWNFVLAQQTCLLDLLSLLYSLTMQVHSVECYLHCLDVWITFVKRNKANGIARYSEVFSGLMNDLLKKIQFSYNSNQLKEINNVDLDDDNETNWQIFLKKSIELISLIAEFAPIEIFEKVYALWKSSLEVYRSTERLVDQQNLQLNCDLSERERLYFVLRDFSSFTQTLATLSSLFFDPSEEIRNKSIPLIYDVIEKFIKSLLYSVNIKFYNLRSENSTFLDCFIDIHSQLLAALKTILLHLMEFDKLSNETWQQLMDITLPIIQDGGKVPIKIAYSTAQLLLALTGQMDTPPLLNAPVLVRFVQSAPNLDFPNCETRFLVSGAVINLLLKYLTNQNQNQVNQKQFLVECYFDELTREFRQLQATASEARARAVIGAVLPHLSYIVDFCRDFSIGARKILYCTIRSSVEHALILFPSFVKYSDVSNDILGLFLNVLRILQQQMGVDFTKQAVEVFLDVAVNERANLFNIEKLLQILQFVVESHGSFYKNFLPGILQLSVAHVYPYVAAQQRNDHPDDFIALLTLLHSVLLHRWQYFWPSSKVGGRESESNSIIAQKHSQLIAVLDIFAEALTHQDINIFRASLTALEDLNRKWHLYEKIFGSPLLHRFLTLYLKTLTEKTHMLLSEDIQVAVYNVAIINFDGFSTSFLYHFIQDIGGLTPAQQELLLGNFVQNHDRDMPTFVKYLKEFVNDAYHYRRCNMPSPVFVN